MPRKQFIADVQVAADKSILGITSVVRGDDDGEVVACFVPPTGAPIEISLLAQPDVGSYPSESMFMVFTQSNDLPSAATAALETVANFSAGMRLPELITTLSQKLHSAFATGSREAPYSIDDGSDVSMGGVNGNGSSDEESESDDPYAGYDSGPDDFISGDPGASSSATYHLNVETAKKLNRRIRHDLRAAKMAGFTVGVLTGMKAECVSSLVSISIRVAQLGLSEEAIQAWDLEPQNYIVLLIRYSSGYKTFEAVISEPAKSHDIAFRIGISNRYKPTVLEALAAFTDVTKNMGKDDEEEKPEVNDQAGFANLFISSSLNEFITQQFISLLKIRNSVGVGWDGAKRYFNDKQGKFDEGAADLPSTYYEEPSEKDSTLPTAIANDHLTDHQVKQISFPLIAAQFAMRYLVRCTDFCLVCHDKIEEDFEALKPYVCSKPLCLYQYMSLGFGPSVEHEILTQPYVVDLLVSFCYASAYNRRLREYPTGMSLSVPPVSSTVTRAFANYNYHQPQVNSPTTNEAQVGLDIKLDLNRQEIIFEEGQTCPVQAGHWIVVSVAGRPSDHYRVEDTSLFPTIKLSDLPVTRVGMPPSLATMQANMSTAVPTPATTPPPPAIVAAKMSVYNRNFDDLDEIGKAESIVMLLETLPPIKEMKTYLLQMSRFSDPSLKTWKDRISPAALGMLRWIIASNRSCLVQVDKCPGQDDAELAMSKIRLDQRVSNVTDNWVQFRFAQGSPDKEQRFLNALRAQQANFDPQYPSIFAWHGSPLPNWHSIIRSGLDFKEISHGRAYGHGVYHAQDQSVSVGYAQPNQGNWPGSALKITSAMSLNEIVNCAAQFASASPYLVVQHIDWIQCRYLFVQVSATDGGYGGAGSNTVSHASDPSVEVKQDPKYTATSLLRKAIGVPACAVKVSRSFRTSTQSETPSSKRRKNGFSGSKSPMVEMGVASEGETLSDLEFLFSEDETPPANEESKSKGKAVEINGPPKVNPKLIDFVPGSLDQSSLPMLEPPSYATSTATKTLNRNLREVLEIQKKTPLHELGWYIDQELVSNVYQWIVELHSFEASLPLAQDMKKAGVTSIVLEIRFGKDYPFSPPFVRVIRPRFMPFAAGGGGHVTAGGAMCMELLTNSGWSSVSTIESVLLQVRMAIMNTEPKPARLEHCSKAHQRDYGTAEAIDAFIRACRTHGWTVPPGFQDFAGPSGNFSF